MRLCAVIPAAGAGTRLGAPVPKALIEVAGKPILFHTIDRLSSAVEIARIVVPVPPDEREALCRRYADERLTFVDGGASRTNSVAAALKALGAPSGLVLIHDAARPLVDPEVVRRVVEAAVVSGAAIAAAPAVDTIKEADESGCVTRTLARERLWLVQTPQIFEAGLLARAYEAADPGTNVTDDSALVEALGAPVRVVASGRDNFKITTPDDLERFRWTVERG